MNEKDKREDSLDDSTDAIKAMYGEPMPVDITMPDIPIPEAVEPKIEKNKVLLFLYEDGTVERKLIK